MAGVVVLGVLFIVAGLMHFMVPGAYVKIMPPMLSAPWILVYVSGLCEVLGGAGVLVPGTRRWAARGLVALLLAVWPANVYMALTPEHFPMIPVWALWARVPLQIPLILWALWASRR